MQYFLKYSLNKRFILSSKKIRIQRLNFFLFFLKKKTKLMESYIYNNIKLNTFEL